MGDVLERRSLMMRMFAAVSVALLLLAVAPSLFWVILASVLVGLFASVTHIVLPIAPDLVDDSQRGRAIGIVMTGLLMGVLLARTFSGWVSKIHGWRWVFVAAAVLNAAFVPLLWRKMRRLPPKEDLRYTDAMISLWTLFRTEPLLREASIVGALMFASFSCFWTTTNWAPEPLAASASSARPAPWWLRSLVALQTVTAPAGSHLLASRR